MTRSSKLSIRSRRDIGHLLHAHHSSMLDEPVPSELKSFVAQLVATEARKHHSTARAIEVLQLTAAPIGRNSNRMDRPS